MVYQESLETVILIHRLAIYVMGIPPRKKKKKIPLLLQKDEVTVVALTENKHKTKAR